MVFINQRLERLCFGKVEKKNNNNENTRGGYNTIIYYKEKILKADNFEIIPCEGCSLNQKSLRRKDQHGDCQLNVKKEKIKGIKCLNKKKNKSNKIPLNKEEFHTALHKKMLNTFNDLPVLDSAHQCQVVIENLGCVLIEKWIQTNKYKEQLKMLYNNNLDLDKKNEKSKYEFYTDGSLKERGNSESKMGSAWIQTVGQSPNTSFQSSSINWPSFFKAEVIAIFTALLMVPENKEVKIYTDSQACINVFYKLQNPHPKFTKRKLTKIKNWPT